MDAVCARQSRAGIHHDITYRQIFNGQNVMLACRNQADEALGHNPDRISAANALIQARIEECKYLSSANPANIECRQLMMVISLAYIAEDDPYSEAVKAAVLHARFTTRLGILAHNIAHQTFSCLSSKAIHVLPSSFLKTINRIMGCNFISKNGKRSTITLTDLSDHSVNWILAQIDGYFTKRIADDVLHKFFYKNSASHC